MKKIILDQIMKDKYYDYLKDNSFFVKDFYRDINSYIGFKKFIKDKYHLKITDKISNIIDDIELVSSVVDTLK